MADIGRYRMVDGPHRLAADADASKVKVAEFIGEHYVAERIDNTLCIYAIGDGDGLPGVLTGDQGVAGIRELNRRNAPLREPKKRRTRSPLRSALATNCGVLSRCAARRLMR
jgi:hypothetical protein